MRLFHVSEEGNIGVFHPRLPLRKDLPADVGLVWAIDEKHLPNFLTPRNCPRVCFHDWSGASDADRGQYLPGGHPCAVVLEENWRAAMENTTLYLYEFDPAHFELQDDNAGYYTSTCTEVPFARHVIENPLRAQYDCGADVRFVKTLWPIAEAIKKTTLQWSLCRMAFASIDGKAE